MNFSIIQKSQIDTENRLDAEYYQPEYLELDKKLNINHPHLLGSYLEYLTDGAHKTPIYQNDGIMFLSSGLIHENYIDFADAKFISEKEDKSLRHCKPQLNDILISKSGKIGTATVFSELVNCNLFEGVALLRTKNINPYFLSVFLNSRFGQKQIEKLVIGISQPHLHLEQIEKIRIPSIPSSLQANIEKVFQGSLTFLKKSENLYQKANDLLLEEMELKDFQVTEDLNYVVNYSDTGKVNRIDADYFQPKYEELLVRIKKHNPKSLGQLVSMKKGFEPGSEAYQDEGKTFIRVSSLSKNGVENKDQKCLSDELYQKLKGNFEPKVGEILLTKDATLGIAYVLKEPVEGVISGGILRLTTKTNLDLEYLALCINSMVGQLQAERDAGGSIIVHWKPEQIRNVLIPILPKEVQQKIADLVKKSHEARKKSKQLLEEAKSRVEEMIEKNAV